MANKTILKLLTAALVFSVLLGTQSLAPAKEEGQSSSQALRVHLVDIMNLRGDKAKTFIEAEEKYDRIRQEALERINKSQDQLGKLLSSKKPDAEKLKKLISVIASDQDILVNTYKLRRDETLAMLTPVQQGQYLNITWKWQQKLLEKYKQPKTGQKSKKNKEKAR
ncbi:MAG: hypothetical protein PHU44_18420 [Syntrophales bacterium]|nr:hypothetical protein [Syntrophales bacterium]MDD5641331.1 hypothetical protein [Syntrophales bacterium]